MDNKIIMKKLLFSIIISLAFLFGFSIVLAQTPTSTPASPIITSVVAGDGQITIYFDMPTGVETSSEEAFRVVSTPGNYKFTATSSPCIVTGLTNGVSYSFVITAINSIGTSEQSSSSLPVMPTSTTIIIPTDVCTNIDGIQVSIPEGMILNNSNECVTNNPKPNRSVNNTENGNNGGEIIQTISNSTTSTTFATTSSQIISSSSENNTAQNASNTLSENVVNAVNNITEVAKEQITVVAKVTQDIVENTKNYVNTPTGDKVTKTITTVGVFGSALAAVSSSFASPLAIPEMFLIPLRLWGLLLTAFGLKKKNRSWGTVYDSITKQPIDPAIITLKDLSGKEIASSITDLDGRYGFLVGPGKYIIEAQKTNYSYPSSKLSGKISDEVYNNLYFGGEIDVLEGGLLINKNIPMDPIGFDWNEFAKGKNKLMSFYSKKEMFLDKLSDILFELGFIIAVLALCFAPEPYNIGIVALYLIILGFKIFGIKTKTFGKLSEMTDGSPLSFAIVKIFSEDWSMEIGKKVADKYGRYYGLVPVGKYHIKIDKKNNDETYSEVYQSPILDISNGVLNRNFSV